MIDGQQRLTTTMLLLVSLRDALGQEGAECRAALQGALYRGEEGGRGELEDGQDLPASRLLPSFSDRKSFFQLVEGKGVVEDGSYQARAKALFDRRVAEEMAGLEGGDRVKWVEGTLRAALDRMSVTLVEIVTEINMAQVFLWLQEKSLFGEAALVENKFPGVFFSGADLVRNLVLAPTMGWRMEEQEQFHLEHWLRPVEQRLVDGATLNTVLAKFVDTQPTEHCGSFEKQAEPFLKGTKVSMSPEGKRHIRTYALFSSMYEEADSGGKRGTLEASLTLLARLGAFIDSWLLAATVQKDAAWKQA